MTSNNFNRSFFFYCSAIRIESYSNFIKFSINQIINPFFFSTFIFIVLFINFICRLTIINWKLISFSVSKIDSIVFYNSIWSCIFNSIYSITSIAFWSLSFYFWIDPINKPISIFANRYFWSITIFARNTLNTLFSISSISDCKSVFFSIWICYFVSINIIFSFNFVNTNDTITCFTLWALSFDISISIAYPPITILANMRR